MDAELKTVLTESSSPSSPEEVAEKVKAMRELALKVIALTSEFPEVDDPKLSAGVRVKPHSESDLFARHQLEHITEESQTVSDSAT